jgi:putative hydrolase of the HAD superfamily
MASDRQTGRPAALLLDFGSVVTRSVFEIADVAEQRLGLTPGALDWRGALDPATDALWRDMQADLITERMYWERRAAEIGACLGKAWTPLDFFRAIRGSDLNEDVRPEMTALVRDARAAGLKVGVLSNELELFAGREAMKGLDILRLMDFVVDGTHTGILKPDPRAYAMALERLAEQPGDVLFVDDQARNVLGAREAGMLVHHFRIEDPGCSVNEIRWVLGI